jgi:hypothetical protein
MEVSMDIVLNYNVKLALGASQGVGALCSGFGSRAMLLTETIYCSNREKEILRMSLERANLKTLHLEFFDGDDPYEFAKMVRSMLYGSKSEAIVVFGGNRLIHLARWMVNEESDAQKLKLVLVPAIPGTPFLLRPEGFWGSGHPTDSKFYTWNSPTVPTLVFDPYLSTTMGAKQSVAHLFQTLFFLLEAVFHEQAGLVIKSLCFGAIESIWLALEKIYEQPTKADIRLESFEAGLAAALAQHILPRLAGSTAIMVLEGITFVAQGMIGAILSPWLLENLAPRSPEMLKKIAKLMNFAFEDESPEALGIELGRLVRKLLTKFELPLRLRDIDLVEAELIHAAELTKDWKTPTGGIISIENLGVFLRSAF